MAYGIHVIYMMKPGKREEFLSDLAAQGIPQAVRAEDGCLQYDYFIPVDESDQLLLMEKWTAREAQQVHLTQPHMALLKPIKERCVLEVKLETYDL